METAKKHIIQPDDPNILNSFRNLKIWIEDSLDIFRDELLRALYPLFVHIYLDLIATRRTVAAKEFFSAFREDFEQKYTQKRQELSVLVSISDPIHLRDNTIGNNYRSHKYHLSMGKYAFDLFISYLEENNLTHFLKIISHYFDIKVYPGSRKIEEESGILGVEEVKEATLDLNTQLVTKECEEAILNDEKYKYDTLEQFVHQLKKSKDKEGSKTRPNMNLTASYIQAEIEKLKDLCKRVSVCKNHLPSICCYTVHNSGDGLCCAEISEDCSMIALGYQDSYIEIQSLKGELKKLKTSSELGRGDDEKSKKAPKREYNKRKGKLNEVNIDDGFGGSNLGGENQNRRYMGDQGDFYYDENNIDAVHGGKNNKVSDPIYINDIVGRFEDVQKKKDDFFEANNFDSVSDVFEDSRKNEIDYNLEHIYGKQTMEKKEKNKDTTSHLFDNIGTSAKLIGHSGPVYCVKFFKGNKFLLSCSQDCTIRLWSLELFTCLAVYKAHVFPIWTVDVSSDNFYFASGGSDKQALIWSIQGTKPERLLISALSDVTVVRFHPNGNYLFTGSNDCKIRMHSIQDGSLLRIFNGHTEGITCIEISSCGKYLLSGARDKNVILWDIVNAKAINKYPGNEKSVYSVAFCWFGTVIASVGADNSVRLWDRSDTKTTPICVFYTKNTPLLHIRFGYRNIISVVGPYNG